MDIAFLKDGEGNFSSTRLIMVAWAFGILGMWVIMCFMKGDFLDIPLGLGAIMGYIVGGKAIQAFAEKPAAPKPVVKAPAK